MSSKNLLPSCPHKAHHPFQPRLMSVSQLLHWRFFRQTLQWTYNFLELRRYSRHFLKKMKLTGYVSSNIKKLWNHSHRTTTQTELPLSSHIIQLCRSSYRCKQIFPSPSIVAYKWSSNLGYLPYLPVRSTLRDYSIQQLLPASQNAIIYTALYLSIFLQTRPSQLH